MSFAITDERSRRNTMPTELTLTIWDDVAGVANLANSTVNYSLNFSAAVTGLEATDFEITNGTLVSITGGGSDWTVQVKAGADLAGGQLGLTLKAGSVVDGDGNTNAAQTDNGQSIDTLAPVAPKLVTTDGFTSIVDPQVTFKTSYGNFVVELFPDEAPATVANMLTLVNGDFYNSTVFHRVVPGFVIQGGGFTSGYVQKNSGYAPIPLESDNGLSNLRGTLAMARTSEPDSATSQFYVNLVDNGAGNLNNLDYQSASKPGYAVFGEVISGMSAVDTIASVQTYKSLPLFYVFINDATQTLAGSAVSNSGKFEVLDVEAGANWQYSLDGGANWSNGDGSELVVPEGDYDASKIQLRQIDVNGNPGARVGYFSSDLLVDTTPPAISLAVPADAAINVAADDDIVLTFSEAVEKGSGQLVLKLAGGETVAIYDIADSTAVTIEGNTLTLNPSANLAFATQYQLLVDAGIVVDYAGNAYAGGFDYAFTTAPGIIGGTIGSDGDDRLQGSADDDGFSVGLGNDIVAGGAGQDTVLLPMFANVFSFQQVADGMVTGTYDDYSLELSEVEYVEFGSTGSLARIPLGELIDGSAQERLGQLTDLYLAFFGRAPDVGGLEYWQRQLLDLDLENAGLNKDFAQIAKDFAWSQEAQALYPPGGSNRDFVQTVYQNCFARDPDAGGWNYWTGVLDAKGQADLSDRGAFVAEVIFGAYAPTSGAEDRNLLSNRHEVALYYVNQLLLHPEEGYDTAIDDLIDQISGEAGMPARAAEVIGHAFANPISLAGVLADQTLYASLWGD